MDLIQSRYQPVFRHMFPAEGKVQIGNNQSRSPLLNIILFSFSMYLHLFEIAIYLLLGSIGDTTEFQLAFRIILRRIIFLRQLTVDEER